MRMKRETMTELVEVQFTTRAEARTALDRLEEFGVTVDIVRARVERGDVAYELLLQGRSREVAQAARECRDWAAVNSRAFARAG